MYIKQKKRLGKAAFEKFRYLDLGFQFEEIGS